MNDASPARSLPTHRAQNWHLRKPGAKGKGGMVVSQSRVAAEIGAEVLQAGGNAVDAAVATAFAVAVVEPWNSGLGGIGHALIHPAGAAEAEQCDFGPVAPGSLSPSQFKLTGRMTTDLFAWPEVEGDKNIHGPLSIVPNSSPAGYAAIHKKHGRMPFAELVAPAVALARRGLPIDWYASLKIASSAKNLRRYPESARIYLPDGLPPAPPYMGAIPTIVQGKLADTLAVIKREGVDPVYRGDIAASIAADMKDLGGVLNRADLEAVAPVWRKVLKIPHGGFVVQGASAMTAGPTMARVLGQMAGQARGKAPDAGWYTALARALHTAYVERLSEMGSGNKGHTTHITTADKDGMMVAMTTTLMSGFGSCVALPGTGIMMNNGVMWFDPRPDTPNGLAGGKRPLTNMCPAIVLKDGVPMLAGGASGGRKILASVVQMLAFVLDFGMSPEDAGHQPRIDVSSLNGITADPRLGEEVIAALRAAGPVTLAEHVVLPGSYANPNAILREADGTLSGMSDTMIPWSGAVAA
jgi:gamma-glutamyltranspeptidase/glutathione hydrolase